MKVIIFTSLVFAFGFLIAYLFLGRNRSGRNSKYLAGGAGFFYAVFFATAILFYQLDKNAVVAFSGEVRPKNVTKNIEVKEEPSLTIRTKVSPSQMGDGKETLIEFIFRNDSQQAIDQLRMKFIKNPLEEFFDIQSISYESLVEFKDGIVMLGLLKPKEEKNIVFAVKPNEEKGYEGKVAWFDGESEILDKDQNQLITNLEIPYFEVEIKENINEVRESSDSNKSRSKRTSSSIKKTRSTSKTGTNDSNSTENSSTSDNNGNSGNQNSDNTDNTDSPSNGSTDDISTDNGTDGNSTETDTNDSGNDTQSDESQGGTEPQDSQTDAETQVTE